MRIRIIGAILALVLAVVGAIVVIIYVRDADIRAANGAALVPVYVVEEDVPAGTAGELIADFVKVERLASNSVQPDHVTSLEDLEGMVTTIALLPGDQLVSGRFADPVDLAAQGNVIVPDGLQEVTLALPVEQVVGGAIRGGSKVGVVVTLQGEDFSATTKFALQDVLVTRVQAGDNYVPPSTDEDKEADQTPVATIMVTLALSTPDVERIVFAAELQQSDAGGIWLTLQPKHVETDGSLPVTGETFFE
jgi:Flp pilus assembly protein CpaB